MTGCHLSLDCLKCQHISLPFCQPPAIGVHAQGMSFVKRIGLCQSHCNKTAAPPSSLWGTMVV